MYDRPPVKPDSCSKASFGHHHPDARDDVNDKFYPIQGATQVGQAKQTLRGLPYARPLVGPVGKKIRGQLHDFGVWADPEAALERLNREYPYLKEGRDLHKTAIRHPRSRPAPVHCLTTPAHHGPLASKPRPVQ